MTVNDMGDWLRIGIERHYCTQPACSTHDGTPLEDDEIDQFEEGWDPCVHIVRLYEQDEKFDPDPTVRLISEDDNQREGNDG